MRILKLLSILAVFMNIGFFKLQDISAAARSCDDIYKSCSETAAVCSAKKETCEKNKAALESLTKSVDSFDVDVLSVGNESQLKLQGEHDDTNIISKIIKLFSQLLGMVAVGLYIIGAYFLITAQDEQGLQQGKDIFVYTTMGLIVAFLSYIIVQFIINIIFGA